MQVLIGADCDLPLPGRWGSKERGVAGIVGGIMCHGILQSVVEQGFSFFGAQALQLMRKVGTAMTGTISFSARRRFGACGRFGYLEVETIALIVMLSV